MSGITLNPVQATQWADPLLAPHQWCSEKWSYFASPLAAEECFGDIIARILLVVPLALITAVASLGWVIFAL